MKNETILSTDGYKLDHRRQSPKGTEYVYANFTPRSCAYYPEAEEGAVVFGIQYLIINRLMTGFNEGFFKIPKDEAVSAFSDRVNSYLGENKVGSDHIAALWDLQYLPIRIKALPEGTLCPIRVPMLTIINTNPKFFWLTNYLETLVSCELWLPVTSATTARLYKKNLKRHFEAVGLGDITYLDFLCHDFSMRGMSCIEAAVASGMGHLTSFMGSETIPAIKPIERFYGSKQLIASTIPATEHSVMCEGGDGEDEFETFKRLITKVYPKGNVSIVSDTWDLWKVVNDYLPRLKDIINKREGRVVIRPDSGDPVDIICGVEPDYAFNDTDIDTYSIVDNKADKNTAEVISSIILDDTREQTPHGECGNAEHSLVIKVNNDYYKCTIDNISWNRYDKQYYYLDMDEKPNLIIEKLNPTTFIGLYEALWNTFGGVYTDSKAGFKILNGNVGVIYGDAITLDRQNAIYARLAKKRFTATNLVLGIGSYTYQYKTRDSLGFAMKATWCQIKGVPKEIFKDPKTDTGVKKSLKGLIKVELKDGRYVATDQVCPEEENSGCLETVFLNGKLIRRYIFDQIRENVNNTLKNCR